MRLARAALALAALASSPGPARAEPVLALRLGVAPALGSASGNLPMADAVPVQLPVELDALWRAGPLAGGLYGSWGPARAGDCRSGERCSATVWRAGAQGTWTFDLAGAAPWAGLALGWEWAEAVSEGAGTLTSTFSGPEVGLQGGLDWRLLPWLALGPYGLVGIGSYGTYRLETPAGAASATLSDRAVHAWIQLGVRATFTPWGAP